MAQNDPTSSGSLASGRSRRVATRPTSYSEHALSKRIVCPVPTGPSTTSASERKSGLFKVRQTRTTKKPASDIPSFPKLAKTTMTSVAAAVPGKAADGANKDNLSREKEFQTPNHDTEEESSAMSTTGSEFSLDEEWNVRTARRTGSLRKRTADQANTVTTSPAPKRARRQRKEINYAESDDSDDDIGDEEEGFEKEEMALEAPRRNLLAQFQFSNDLNRHVAGQAEGRQVNPTPAQAPVQTSDLLLTKPMTFHDNTNAFQSQPTRNTSHSALSSMLPVQRQQQQAPRGPIPMPVNQNADPNIWAPVPARWNPDPSVWTPIPNPSQTQGATQGALVRDQPRPQGPIGLYRDIGGWYALVHDGSRFRAHVQLISYYHRVVNHTMPPHLPFQIQGSAYWNSEHIRKNKLVFDYRSRSYQPMGSTNTGIFPESALLFGYPPLPAWAYHQNRLKTYLCRLKNSKGLFVDPDDWKAYWLVTSFELKHAANAPERLSGSRFFPYPPTRQPEQTPESYSSDCEAFQLECRRYMYAYIKHYRMWLEQEDIGAAFVDGTLRLME